MKDNNKNYFKLRRNTVRILDDDEIKESKNDIQGSNSGKEKMGREVIFFGRCCDCLWALML
jgi:hypothetical protein